MGKPMGNGFPVSAVVTRREIANSLGNGVSYFNTYGGNPVACTAVIAVFNVMKAERLQEHANKMGQLFEPLLNKLKAKHKCVGDVRGVGLFWGIDVVADRDSRKPDSKLAYSVIAAMRQEEGILLSVDGPYENVIKIKPPLCFDDNNVKQVVTALDDTFAKLSKK